VGYSNANKIYRPAVQHSYAKETIPVAGAKRENRLPKVSKKTLSLTVNGHREALDVAPRQQLLDTLQTNGREVTTIGGLGRASSLERIAGEL